MCSTTEAILCLSKGAPSAGSATGAPWGVTSDPPTASALLKLLVCWDALCVGRSGNQQLGLIIATSHRKDLQWEQCCNCGIARYCMVSLPTTLARTAHCQALLSVSFGASGVRLCNHHK